MKFGSLLDGSFPGTEVLGRPGIKPGPTRIPDGVSMFACIHAPATNGHSALLECAYAFSPQVEETTPDSVVLDVEGFEHLLGSPREIASEIARRALELGLQVRIAVAQNPDAAIHAARGFAGITVIPPGEEAKFLGSLPLELLSPPLAGVENTRALEILETLRLWGLRCFRDFAALPEAGVSERLGPEGVRLQKLARGASVRPLVATTQAPGFELSAELEHPVTLLESLSFILGRLLNQLFLYLEARGLATNELRLRLQREDQTEYERTLRLPFPTRDRKACLRLLQLELELHPPQAPIVAVSLAAEPVKPRVIQNGLFLPPAPEPEKLELTLGRIANLVGADNVGSPELLDTHRPGAFRIRRFGVDRPADLHPGTPNIGVSREHRGLSDRAERADGETGKAACPSLAFRAFRPPLRAKVQASLGRPTRVRARGVRGKVVALAGPWRTSGDWWTPNPWARDEWDVSIHDSEASSAPPALYRIYRDLRTGGWFVDGSYD